MLKENVAIILAVSDYSQANSLPGCKNDGALMGAILQKTGKFAPDNTLHIDAETNSSRVKADLAAFIGGLAGREIGEVFFFYTGHGLFDGTTFYFLLSDYSPARTQGTTLTNAELDEMLRSLAPDLAVKVIDACYSGQQYVKSPEEFEKAIKATGTTYKRCYFMFSSEQTQPSWQNGDLSYFTLELARAIQQHSSPTIRYKDIIDYISDSFASNARQKPIFVVQANFTEEFCAVDDSLRQAIAAFVPKATLASITTTTATQPPKRPITEELKERVRREAERFCSEEEAAKIFAVMKDNIEAYHLPDPVGDFYTLKPTFMVERYEVPNSKAIGEWLQKNQGDYFARLLFTQEAYETEEAYYPRRSGLSAFAVSLFPEYRTVTKHRDVVSGFDSTVGIPFKSVHLVAEPKLQNVPWWKWYCAFIISKSDMRCFVSLVRLREINWKERREEGKVEWRFREFPMKDSSIVKEHLDELLNQLAEPITRYLLEKHGLAEDRGAEAPTLATTHKVS